MFMQRGDAWHSPLSTSRQISFKDCSSLPPFFLRRFNRHSYVQRGGLSITTKVIWSVWLSNCRQVTHVWHTHTHAQEILKIDASHSHFARTAHMRRQEILILIRVHLYKETLGWTSRPDIRKFSYIRRVAVLGFVYPCVYACVRNFSWYPVVCHAGRIRGKRW